MIYRKSRPETHLLELITWGVCQWIINASLTCVCGLDGSSWIMDCYSWLSIQTGRDDGKVALTAHFCLHFSLSLFFSVWSAELVTLSLEEDSLAAYAHGVSQRTPTSALWQPGIAEIWWKRSHGWCKRWLCCVVMMCHTVTYMSDVNYLSQGEKESYI